MSNYNSMLVQQQVKLSDYHRVKVIKQGNNIVDVVAMERKTTPSALRISKNEYVVISGDGVGEVRQYKQTNGKTNIESLTRTFRKLRQLINCNFSGGSAELFITLTYAENMQDTERLYNDFKRFWQRLKYYYSKYDFGYISVAEPQGRGAWHLHLLIKDIDGKPLYIDNKDLEKIWGLGYTDTQRLKADNIGAYLSAYFCNIPVSNSKNNKQYIKGARLVMYPKGMRFWRASRNLKKPIIEVMTYGELRAIYGKPVYRKQIDIKQDGNIVNRIVKEQYNLNRKV